MKISRQQIVDAALRLLDDEGLDGFSLRRLAPRLGVETPAIYWHIKSKAELLGLMAAQLHLRARRDIPADIGWREWLIALGRETHDAMRNHRDAARLCTMVTPVGADSAEVAALLAAPLERCGLPRRLALSRQASVIALSLGWALYEQRDREAPFLSPMLSFDESFEAGLQAMVRGFEEP